MVKEEILTLSENTNNTDPVVIFDPKFQKTKVAKIWEPEDPGKENQPGVNFPTPQSDLTTICGVEIPIIKINSQIINELDIIYVKLNYTGFKPSLEIILRSANYLRLETPGMANKVTLIIVPAADGVYKTISIDFYIVSMQEYQGKVRYYCDYFFPDLEKKYTKSLKSGGNNSLSTYQLLESIAKECKMGFASTEKCKDVSDNKIRLLRNQNYQEVISEHLKFSGIDDNSIFDSWIDLYGYIVMCNISWVLNSSVNVNELSIKMLSGINLYSKEDFKENNIQYGDDTFRTFTNWKGKPNKDNGNIENYEWIINNSYIKINGTDNIYYTVSPISNGGTNNIVSENIKIEENSTDGYNFKNAYTFQKSSFIGTEMGNKEDGNTPVLYQEKRRNAYLAKLDSRKLKITLKDINLGLNRGTLINVNIFEYDRQTKAEMMRLSANLKSGGNQTTSDKLDISEYESILNDNTIGVPNLSISGIYFIDGMEIVFDSKKNKYIQSLILIRKSEFNSYLNMSSLPKL